MTGAEGEILTLKEVAARLKAGRRTVCRLAQKGAIPAFTLEEKLAQQKKQRELEAKRGKLRRELFDRQDEIEAQRNGLIEQLEGQLEQRVEEKTLFTIEWKLR